MLSEKNDGQKRYDKFTTLYRDAHPQMTNENQFKNRQEMWKKVKNNKEVYGETAAAKEKS